MKSPSPRLKASIASGIDSPSTKLTSDMSTLCLFSAYRREALGRRRVPTGIGVAPLRSVHRNWPSGARPTRKNPSRLFISTKWTATSLAPASAATMLGVGPVCMMSAIPSVSGLSLLCPRG